MKHCLLICSLFAAVLVLSSCSTTRYVSAQDDFNAVWKGHSYAEIINAYGAPDRETADGADGIILVYEQTTVTTSTSSDGFYYRPWFYGPYGGPWGPTVRTTTSTEKDYVHFYVNNEDKCYSVRTNQMKPDGRELNVGATIAAASLGTLLGLGILGGIIGACCGPVVVL